MAEYCRHPVLLVDDEPDILFSLKALLRREFELYTAESGQAALQILAEHPIHIVMTDQRMPEMTGVELLGRVRIQFPDTIRILFTGYADVNAVVNAINTGGLYRYVTKPWDPDDLIELLHDAASQFDEVVEHRQLLVDLRAYLANTCHVEPGSEQSAGSDRRREATMQSVELLDRIEKLLHRTTEKR